MENEVERILITRFDPEGKSSIEESVAKEFPVTIVLNNQELVTLLCSPKNLDYLVVGYLSSEGFIKSKDEIIEITVDDQRGVVRVDTVEAQEIAQDVMFKRLITLGGGSGAPFYNRPDVTSQKVKSDTKISADEVFTLISQFQHNSEVYWATHGVHGAALAHGSRVLFFTDDIGRHNAVDKVFGRCLLEGIATDDKVLIISCRISSEIMYKAAKRGVPIIASISVPTDLGVKLATDLAITLIGSVKVGGIMKVYTNDWRVITV